MTRAAVFLVIPVVIAGFGAAMLHRHGMLSSNALVAPATAQVALTPGPVLPTIIGMNVSGLDYYSGEWAFADLVQTSATIYFVDPKGAWHEPPGNITLDATGHPVHVPKGTDLAIILQNGTVRLETGSYDCKISDGWKINPFGDWKMKGTAQHFTMVIDQPIPKAGVTVKLTATRDDAALDTFSCIRQGAANTLPFNPTFLAETRPFKVLRLMYWMRTNNAPKRVWADRTTPASFTQGGPQGVAIEHMVALANATGADPWFNMPMDADPAYYENFATYVRDHLDPKLKAYVEFSNEVWNEGFEQGKTATQRGTEAYPNVEAPVANDFYYADRVRDVMGVWSKVFASQPKRLVRVLAEQAVWPDRADRALAHKDTWKSVDVLAIAPYFTTNAYDLPGTGAARIDALFKRAPIIIGEAIDHAIAAKKIAHKYNLKMVTYEAGPSFLAYQKEIGADMLAANRDPRIYDMYTTFLKRWQAEVGGLIVLFDAVATPGSGGQYGHREYTGQPVSEAPKARAVEDFIAQQK